MLSEDWQKKKEKIVKKRERKGIFIGREN